MAMHMQKRAKLGLHNCVMTFECLTLQLYYSINHFFSDCVYILSWSSNANLLQPLSGKKYIIHAFVPVFPRCVPDSRFKMNISLRNFYSLLQSMKVPKDCKKVVKFYS